MALPAVEGRVCSLGSPADLRVIELRGFPAHELEFASEVLLVTACTVSRGIRGHVEAFAGLDPLVQRLVTIQTKAFIDALRAQLMAGGARTDPLELRVCL